MRALYIFTICISTSVLSSQDTKQIEIISVSNMQMGPKLIIRADGKVQVHYGADYSFQTPRGAFPPADVMKMLSPYMMTKQAYRETIGDKISSLYDARKISLEQMKEQQAKAVTVNITFVDESRENYVIPQLEPAQKLFLQVLDKSFVDKLSLSSWMFKYPPFGLEQVVIKENQEQNRKTYNQDKENELLENRAKWEDFIAELKAKDKASLNDYERRTLESHENEIRSMSNMRSFYNALKSKKNFTDDETKALKNYELLFKEEDRRTAELNSFKQSYIAKSFQPKSPIATANPSQPISTPKESSTPWFIFATIGTCLAVFAGFLYKGWKLSSSGPKK